jgi:hypothetical protein
VANERAIPPLRDSSGRRESFVLVGEKANILLTNSRPTRGNNDVVSGPALGDEIART